MTAGSAKMFGLSITKKLKLAQMFVFHKDLLFAVVGMITDLPLWRTPTSQ
jgi:hypothetical protein